MDRRKVPRVVGRSEVALHQVASHILRQFCPAVLRGPESVPLAELVEFDLVQEAGIELRIVEQLPVGVEGLTRPSADGFGPTIEITDDAYERLYQNHPRTRFTVAHELGHALFHVDQLQHSLSDGDPVLYRRPEIPAYADPEWQANAFAAGLLMPTTAVRKFVELNGDDPHSLAKTFNVSNKAAEIRIERLRSKGKL